MISKDKINKLKEYFNTQPVDLVYLFGSQAIGKETNLSDFDFGILFKKGLPQGKCFDLRLEMITKLCGLLKAERVDVVDLGKAPLKFKYQAIFPKKVIVNNNEKRMIELEYHTVFKYLDFRQSLSSIAKRQIEIMAEKGFRDD